MKKIKDFLKNYKQSLLLRNKTWILVFTGVGILFDIFIFRQTRDLVILFLTGLWLLCIWLYKFEGRVSVVGALGFLTMCPFLLIFRKGAIAEKSAIWVYVFLIIGTGQTFAEYLKEKTKGAKKKR